MSYEETVNTQADMLITLEALRKSLNGVAKEMADIEVIIYGNSKDVHDNVDEVDENGNEVHSNKHNVNGLSGRVVVLQDKCRYSQHALDKKKDALILYCQQFAFAHDMVPVCAEICNCRDT